MDDGTCDQRFATDAEQAQAQAIIAGCTGALPTYDSAMLIAGSLPPQCLGTAAASALTYSPAVRPSVTLTKIPAAANLGSLGSRLGQLARARRLTLTR